ncbi:MAG: hypothetical protein ABIQ12_07315 [Opitutaceae bacterium]
MLIDRGTGVFEIRLEVGAKMETTIFSRVCRQQVENPWLNDAILMVPQLRPWIGEKQKDMREQALIGESFKKQPCLRLDEVHVAELRADALANRAVNTIPDQIDANTPSFWMGFGVSGKKMTMPTANFTDDWPRTR